MFTFFGKKFEMHLPKPKKFDLKKVEQLLVEENKFITELLSVAAIPERRQNENEDASEEENGTKPTSLPKKPRAKSLQELEDRLKAITSKKKLSYKEKLTKKGLKNRMKKKSKQDERNSQSKLERAAKLSIKNEEETKLKIEVKEEAPKPVFNVDDKLVFSKIDFANVGKKKTKKQEKDPKKILKKLAEEKEKLNELAELGEQEKVNKLKEKIAWKNALAKAEGEKIKDDPILLKKSVQKHEQKKRSSKKKWDARIHGVEKAKEDRQKKRSDNISKKKKEKKTKKLKTAAKRGKIIPGF